MNERFFADSWRFDGTLAANETIYYELPYPWALLGFKAVQSNDGSATIAVSAAGGGSISATAIGDSGNPASINLSSDPLPIDADELVTITLDYDGSSGTAGADIHITLIGLVGG